MSIPDPYKVLQVDPEAEGEVIAAAYKRLARLHHPDVSHDPEAVDKMVQINQAWEMLRDPARRAAVDRARTRASATSARVVAAEGKAQAAAAHGQPPFPDPAAQHDPASPSRRPFPGVPDPAIDRFEPGAEASSGNWTSGRSDTGYRYDARTMGWGAAGPPPGRPSGSIVSFGRYEGWTLGEIARRDLEYLEWLDRMPIGRTYQAEIDALLRQYGRRTRAPGSEGRSRGLFRRR